MSSRFWLAATVALTLVVMGGMVAWGLRERSRPGQETSWRPGGARKPTRIGPVEPDREFEMPPDCEVDPKAPPKLVFDLENDTIDFGPMRQGQVLTKEVTLRNVGSGPLCIANVHAGCGCIQAALVGDRRIEPTGTRTVKVTVDVGPARHGPQTKNVQLYTNEPGRKVATFRVLADVRLGVAVLDPVAQFGRVMRGKPATAVVRLRSPAADAAWTVTSVEGTKASYGFEVEEAPSSEPGFRLVQLRVKHPGTEDMGPQADTVKVKTSHPERPEFLVHTNLTVVDRYFAAPVEVPFGFMEKDLVGSWFLVRVLAADPQGSVPFAGARIEGSGFEVGETRPEGAGEWTVAVRPDTRGLSGGRVRAALVIALDDPETKEIRVPLRVEVLSRESREARAALRAPEPSAMGK